MSASKLRIQTYLKRNRVSELFEDMMSKLIQDLPSQPVEYLVQFLQRKVSSNKKSSSKDIMDMKSKSMKVSSHSTELWADSKSGSKKADKFFATQEVEGRQYSKPWLANSKKEKSLLKDKNQQVLSLVSPVNRSLTSEEVGFLELDGKKPSEVPDDKVYQSAKVYGKPRNTSNTENNEFSCKKIVHEEKTNSCLGKSLKSKEAKKMRRKHLKQSLAIDESRETRLDFDVITDDNDDDALELYENAEELREEGVKNPPKTGVYTSGDVSHPREQIELVLNMSKFFDSLGGAVSVASYNHQASSVLDDNDDFESASQVTGPRRPVWEAPNSEVESVTTNKALLKTSRKINTSIFDVQSPAEPKSPSRSSSIAKAGSAVSKSAEKPLRKTSSQVSNASRRSLEAIKSSLNVSGGTGRRKESCKDSVLSRKSQERPKTAQ